MTNPTQITFHDKHADYYSCHFLRELKESDPAAFFALRDTGTVYFTVCNEELTPEGPVSYCSCRREGPSPCFF